MATRSAPHLLTAVLAAAGACSPAGEQPSRPTSSAPVEAEAPAPVPLDTLLVRLRAASPEVRAEAATALADHGPRLDVRLRALRAALNDPNREVGENAAWALGTIGAASVPILVDALSDSRALVRIRALSALARVGQPAASAREAIRKAMGDPDPSVRRMASVTITRIGPRPSGGAGAATLGTVADLRAGLAARDPRDRLSAVRRFQPFVDHPDQSIRLLLRALADTDPGVRGAAADALVSLGPPARTALTAALSDSNPVVRREASVALVRLGALR